MSVKRIDLDGKVWSDERGWSLGFVKAAGIEGAAVGNFHMATIRPGCVRGNHRHPNATEWLVIAGGEAEVAWREGEQGPTRTERVSSQVPVMYEFGAGTAHGVRNVGPRDLVILAFNDCDAPVTERCEIL